MEIYGFIKGEKKSLTQLAAESGVSYDTLLARYKAGVPFGELTDVAGKSGGVSDEALAQLRSEIERFRPNLLDNSDFSNPVNQRGQTDYTTSAGQSYTIDRWIKRGSTTTPVTLSSDGLTVTNNGSSSYVAIKQAVADDRFSPAGKTVTAAVKIKSLSGTGRLRITGGSVAAGDTTVYKQATFSKTGVFVISCTIPDTLSYAFFGVAVSVNEGSAVTLEWAALYEGEYTEDTLPVYQPNGYAAELAECQRYQYVINQYTPVYGCLNGTKTILYLALPIPVTMRTKPVITNLSVIGVRTTIGGNVTPEITSFSVDEFSPQTVTLGVNTASFNTSSYTANTPVFAYLNSGLLDANL